MIRYAQLILALWLVAMLVACGSSDVPTESVASVTASPAIAETEAATAPVDSTAVIATATASETAVSPSPTNIPTPLLEPMPTNIPTTEPTAPAATPATAPAAGQGLIITHHDVNRFHDIPDEDIAAAGQLTWLFRHASVGVNIQDGLECLMNNFERRPHRCDRDLPAAEILYDSKYDHRNWQFEFHSPPPGQNPGWWNKVGFFIERMNTLAHHEQYDFVSFKMGYVDAHQESNISLFFVADADANLPDYRDIEALQAQLGDTEIIWWTLGLARLSYVESQEFNDQLRDYVAANNGILIDIADIMSHTATGEQCFDNADNGIIALCPEYTDEVNAGHLNATGRLRMAKAIWVLMARLAGWEG